MRVGFDTSVVLRLLVGEPIHLAQIALQYFLKLQKARDQAVISDLVVTETYFALQYHYKVSKKEALVRLHQFLKTDGIENLGVASQVLTIPHLESIKPGFIDRIIYQQYIDETEMVVTFEKAAHKLPKIFVLGV